MSYRQGFALCLVALSGFTEEEADRLRALLFRGHGRGLRGGGSWRIRSEGAALWTTQEHYQPRRSLSAVEDLSKGAFATIR